MQVTFIYMTQVRNAAGKENEQIDVADGSSLKTAIAEAAQTHGDQFQKLVLDADGDVRPSLLVLLNGQSADPGTRLSAGDEITLLGAIAGG